jgi:hypothetical protein
MQNDPHSTSPPPIDTRQTKPPGQRSGEGSSSVLEHLIADPKRRAHEPALPSDRNEQAGGPAS